jgi:hypothetical protein
MNIPSILDIRNITSYFHKKKEVDFDDDKIIFQQLADYNGQSVIVKSENDKPIVVPLSTETTRVKSELNNQSTTMERRTRLMQYLSTIERCPQGKSLVCKQNSQDTDNLQCWSFGFPEGVTIEKL